MKNTALILSVLFLFSYCSEKSSNQVNQKPKSHWPKNGVAYEIFIQSFADSDGDGIGDINGVTSKLDYLVELGVSAIWFMPISESPSYHKYDVIDYKSIHHDYGTMDDFKNLVSKAHERDISIIIDFVINHSSSKHPWFISSSSNTNSPYRDFYVWANRDSIADQIARKETSFDSDNIHQWHAVKGDTLNEYYYGFFNGGMPDLNFDHQPLRDSIYSIAEYWLNDVDVDGFRLDAAKHIYPDDQADKSHAFWAEFKSKMEAIKPDVYLVGEVWSNIETQIPYAKGFDALFNFDIAFSIIESIKNNKQLSAYIKGHAWEVDSSKSFLNVYSEAENEYHQVNPNFLIGTFLSNHDQNRVMSSLNNSQSDAQLAAAILMTMPGHPYLYYGEELGMRGMKPDELIREPFLWAKNDAMQTSWIDADYSTFDSVPSLADQRNNPNSLFFTYKDLIALRNSNTALSEGSMEISDLNNKSVIAFIRESEDQKLLIIHNLSENEIELNIDNFSDVVYSTIQSPKFSEGKVSIPAKGSLILK